MFHPGMFENSRPDGFSVLEIVSEGEAKARFVPLKHTRLGGQIAGPLADLVLTQTFGYAREQSALTLEAVYRFPLPGDAAVTGVVVRFGDVEIVAQLKARAEAETEYKEAVQTGRQAALATRESPDVFTLRVAGLQPDQDVVVETRFVQLARAEGLDWTLRVPLTTAPRYVRDDEADSRHTHGQPLALLRDPGHRFALDVMLEQCGEVRSATHTLDIENAQNAGRDAKRVTLREGEVLPDRDLLLAWRPVQDAVRPGLSVLAHDDSESGYTYFLALVAPPKAPPASEVVAREVVLLVDHSGSMGGAKWAASDWAVKQFLGDLTERDAFALGLFHDRTNWFKQGGPNRESPHAADADTVARAVRFLEGSKDSGGTELGVALEQALKLKRTEGQIARHVLIVTDAEVSDGGRLLRLADTEAARPDHRRISVLCIDAAPNAFLASELAERGGGVAKFLTSEPDEEDISTALDAVLEDFAQPVFADMRLTVDRPGAQASGRSVAAGQSTNESVIDLGDLPRGRAVWVAGRVKRGEATTLHFAVQVGTREVTRFVVDVTQSPAQRPALKALFGARRVLALEYLATAHYDAAELSAQLSRLGYDAKQVLDGQAGGSSYKENAASTPADRLKTLVASEALEYGLASSETAFVAVRTEAGKQIEATVAVTNALPSGWDGAFAGGASVGMAAPAMMRMRSVSAPSSPPSGTAYAVCDLGVSAAAPSVASAQQSAAAMDWMEQDDDQTRSSPLPSVPSPPRKTAFAKLANAVGQSVAANKPAASRSMSTTPLFAGVPLFVNGEAVLFDSGRDADKNKLPAFVTLSELTVQVSGPLDLNALGRDLMLLLYVDDMTTPRARVRLVDLLRQGGTRPLNVQRTAGQAIRLVLRDASGSTPGLPALTITLR